MKENIEIVELVLENPKEASTDSVPGVGLGCVGVGFGCIGLGAACLGGGVVCGGMC